MRVLGLGTDNTGMGRTSIASATAIECIQTVLAIMNGPQSEAKAIIKEMLNRAESHDHPGLGEGVLTMLRSFGVAMCSPADAEPTTLRSDHEAMVAEIMLSAPGVVYRALSPREAREGRLRSMTAATAANFSREQVRQAIQHGTNTASDVIHATHELQKAVQYMAAAGTDNDSTARTIGAARRAAVSGCCSAQVRGIASAST